MEEARYSWKHMPGDYNASYYNDEDLINGKKFFVIDNKTGREHVIDGKVCNGRIERWIDGAVYNEEFVAWAICTSKDYVSGLDESWFTPSVLNYIVEHFEFPQIFDVVNYKLRMVMTKDLWNKAFQRNKEVARYVPEKYMTQEMINRLGELKNLSLINVTSEKLTPELFKKIYFNCDEPHKLNLLWPAPVSPTYRPKRANDNARSRLITQEVADDILGINIRTIWLIPHKFITKEIADKAMDTDPLLIQFVPAKYQTPEYQKKAIDIRPEYLSLIDPSVVTDETIYYALSKKGSVLGCVPKERRTFEICEYAISISGSALKNVPDNIKNADLCFKAVVKYPSAIKYVPVEFLNQEFVDALNSAGVVIPIKNRGYVNECLTINKRLEQEQLDFNAIVSETPELNTNSDYFNIKLESLPGLFSYNSLELLSQKNIMTVGDLLKVSNDKNLFSMMMKSTGVYTEICGVIKLLKCKFMNIDPLIEFVDTGDARSDMKQFSKEIGFSSRTSSVLVRAGISPKELCEVMHNPDLYKGLYRIRNVGETTVQEIVYKTAIVTDFYDKKEKKKKNATEDEMIEILTEELAQVHAEIQRLNARTDEILAKIQEKMLEKNKGGASK